MTEDEPHPSSELVTIVGMAKLRRARRPSRHKAYVLDAIPEGTRVANAVELELRGPGRLFGRVAVPRVRDAVADNLQKLKELLER
jgi:hypothetical protein